MGRNEKGCEGMGRVGKDRRDGKVWEGKGRDGKGLEGMGRDRKGWEGMEWNGKGWEGITWFNLSRKCQRGCMMNPKRKLINKNYLTS